MIAVLGAGPHGRAVAAEGLPEWHFPVLFDDNDPDLESIKDGSRRFPWVIGAAWPEMRHRIAAQLDQFTPPAWENGIIRFPGSQVSAAATIGDHTHLGFNSVVSHGCQVGSFVNICSGVVLGGDVIVGDDVFIGINASVIHGGLKIGAGAIIGAGAVVICDVLPGTTVAGVPARRVVKSKSWWGQP